MSGGNPLALATLALAILSASSEAQTTRGEEIERLLEGAYNPPSTEAQLRSCKFTALTRDLTLDDERSSAVRRAILIERPIDPPPRLRWEEARAVIRSRDSALFEAMPTARDSAKMKRNIDGEGAWWASGACNGKPIPRRPPGRPD
jgi:hypothetical protein